jgi:hypothetical protein
VQGRRCISCCPSRSTNRASNSLQAPENDELGWLPGGPSLAGRGRGHALYLRTLVRLLYSARSEPSDQFGCAGVDVKLRRSGSRRSSSGSMLQASVCRSFQSHGICSRTRNSRPYRYSDSARSAGVSSSDSGSRRLFGSSSRSSPYASARQSRGGCCGMRTGAAESLASRCCP